MKHDETIGLQGLTTAPAQTMGAIRLIPLLRAHIPGDLRIGLRPLHAPAVVSLDGANGAAGIKCQAYVPHGMIVEYTQNGSEASFGASLGDNHGAGRSAAASRGHVELVHRMVKAEAAGEGANRFRFLPLHLAMEGFLALQFGGPAILWKEYSEHAERHGLDPRTERAVRGESIVGLARALRVFERHQTQVGVLVFVADALASVFVVSHPDDYAMMHRSLLEDFFGELLAEYAWLYPDVPLQQMQIDPAAVCDLTSLRSEVARMRNEWANFGTMLASGFVGRTMKMQRVRDAKPFVLQRFMPDFDPNQECHIGERIIRSDGTLEYMKTFRLSSAQVRRAYLLEQLAAADWHLERTAERMRCTTPELAKRLDNAGFGYLLKPHVLAALHCA